MTSVRAVEHAPARATAPALPDVGVLALVPERWGGMWLSRHQVLTRLAEYFHVVWCNPPRSVSRTFSGRPRIAHADPTPPPTRGFAVDAPPVWLPKLYRPASLARALEGARLARARQRLSAAGCKRVVLYIWQPKFARAIDLVDHDASCYHIADEYSFSDVEHPLSAGERRLIERVDQVIIHSPALMEKKGRINPATAYVTNGVDYAHFAAARPEPQDMAHIPHPRIGYVGRLKSQLDWSVLEDVARRRPDWSVVLVGPPGHMGEREDEKKRVLALPNVHYTGNKSVREIPAYTQHMDVCLLCYARTDYTKYIFPLKLHEYLACGKPVVGTDIRSLEEFQHVVRLVRRGDDWCEAIAAALEPAANTPARAEERRHLARSYDWSMLTRRIASLLCDRLGAEYAGRLAGIPEGGPE